MNITVANPFGPSSSLTAELNNTGAITALKWTENTPEHKPAHTSHPVAQALLNYLNNMPDAFDNIECSPQGTPFQQRVWQVLRSIPFGTLATYADIAAAVGSAPRAVGGAVGANPIPIIIPCHRVVGSNGKLTGFSAPGGISTKTKLLAHEGVVF